MALFTDLKRLFTGKKEEFIPSILDASVHGNSMKLTASSYEVFRTSPHQIYKTIARQAFSNGLFRHVLKKIRESAITDHTLNIRLHKKSSPVLIDAITNEVNSLVSSAYQGGSEILIMEEALTCLGVFGSVNDYAQLRKDFSGIESVWKINQDKIYYTESNQAFVYDQDHNERLLNPMLLFSSAMEYFDNSPYPIPPSIAIEKNFNALTIADESVENIIRQYGLGGLMVYYIATNKLQAEANSLFRDYEGTEREAKIRDYVSDQVKKIQKEMQKDVRSGNIMFSGAIDDKVLKSVQDMFKAEQFNPVAGATETLGMVRQVEQWLLSGLGVSEPVLRPVPGLVRANIDFYYNIFIQSLKSYQQKLSDHYGSQYTLHLLLAGYPVSGLSIDFEEHDPSIQMVKWQAEEKRDKVITDRVANNYLDESEARDYIRRSMNWLPNNGNPNGDGGRLQLSKHGSKLYTPRRVG